MIREDDDEDEEKKREIGCLLLKSYYKEIRTPAYSLLRRETDRERGKNQMMDLKITQAACKKRLSHPLFISMEINSFTHCVKLCRNWINL